MKTKIEHGTEHINSNGGIILVGQLLSKSELDREVDRLKVGGTVFPDYSNSACLRSYIGVLAEGRTAFTAQLQRPADRLVCPFRCDHHRHAGRSHLPRPDANSATAP